MARHDKHSEEEFEDHGVLDTPAADTTALNVLGLPTEQVRINLPRGYEDLDDEGVVDDGPEPLSGGSIVLELPDYGAEHPVGHVTRPAADDEREEPVDNAPEETDAALGESEHADSDEPGETEAAPDESAEAAAVPDESVETESAPDERVETDAAPDEPGEPAEHDTSGDGQADGGEPLDLDTEPAVQESDTGDSEVRPAAEPDETGSAPDAAADAAGSAGATDELDAPDAEHLDSAAADADEADPIADADDGVLDAEHHDTGDGAGAATDEHFDGAADDRDEAQAGVDGAEESENAETTELTSDEDAETESAPADDVADTDSTTADGEQDDLSTAAADDGDLNAGVAAEHPDVDRAEESADEQPTGGAEETDDAEAADEALDAYAGQAPDVSEGEDADDAEAAPLYDADAALAPEPREDAVDRTEPDEIAGTTNESVIAPAATDNDATEAEPMASTDASSASNGSSTRFVSQPAAGPRGGSSGESANQLTSDRLIESSRRKVQPEGAWRGFFYRATGGLINLGDSKKVRQRKEVTARIAAPLPGRARFVPVLSRKGGVGKTTVTTLLGMALADGRDDRVVAVDANPDRGTLAERVATRTNRTVRDVVRRHDQIRGYADISDLVARDSTRLDIVASETDPHIADAFDDADYRTVAEVASQYYSLVLTDTGTGIIHSVMGATLDMADQLVVVAGPSVDESRLASETLTWLEAHGREDLVRGAVVVLNQSAPGRSLVRLDELETHFASRVRAVVRLPYDENLATGGAVAFDDLRPETRRAAREAAAHVIEGMRSAALHSVGDEA